MTLEALKQNSSINIQTKLMEQDELMRMVMAQKQREKRRITIILLVVVGVIAFGIIAAITSDDASTVKDKTIAEAAQVTTEPAKVEPIEHWTYQQETDKMEGNTMYFAQCTSTNTVDFEFPYNGGSHFWLITRNMGNGNEVLVKVSKGQFISSYDGSETIRVKFDENKPLTYTISSSSDGSSDVIFINEAAGFIKRLKSAKKVMIAATFFDAGVKHLEFDTDGYEWAH